MDRLPNPYQKNQKGQALIIILLIMSVLLTVVLSVVSRSITEVGVTSYEENALRAFSAAEAGVERALLAPKVGVNSGQLDPSDPSLKYETKIEANSPGNSFIYPKDLANGETATFWFVSHTDDGKLICDSANAKPCFKGRAINFCWGEDPIGYGYEPALEILVFYDSKQGAPAIKNGNFESVRVFRFAYDYEASARGNNFNNEDVFKDHPSCNINNQKQLKYRALVELSPSLINENECNFAEDEGCLIMVKVRMYYNSDKTHPVAITLGPNDPSLPAQGYQISSTGIAGESNRKVNVFQSYPEPPIPFDTAVFSQQDLTK